MKYDILTTSNNIGGRQGWAYICNSGDYKVLKADFTEPSARWSDDYYKFGKVRVYGITDRFPRNYTLTCEIPSAHTQKWRISEDVYGLSANFTFDDALELIENASAPTIKREEPFAIAVRDSKKVYLLLFVLDKGNTIRPLTDEEMDGIVKKAVMWLDR